MATDFTKLLKENRSDESSWDRWFRAIYPRAYFVMYRMTAGDRDLAEDLVQGALENFIASDAIEKVGNDGEAYGYLAKTARNLFVDRLRQRKGSETATDDVEQIEDKSARQRDELLSLDQIADQLEPDDQLLLKLVRAGKSTRELATLLGLGYSTVGMRVSRLRDKMKLVAESKNISESM